ncbi:protein-glutamate O-methyltransferase CheR [Deltaproteobacteria bacterium TL4]
MNTETENEEIELDLLLEAIFRKYGYDFRNYARSTIKRRVLHRLAVSGMQYISEMTQRVLYDRKFYYTLFQDLSINVTEMFRDPSFFSDFRKDVIPYLRTYPFIRIWIPGCATGEEVYSLSIILQEEGLSERSQLYATDFNDTVVQKAKAGIYATELIKKYTANYQKAGGAMSFSDYYTAYYDSAIMDQSLRRNIVFATHNLVTDEIFNEMHVISCRNVMIYFDHELQKRVISLFHHSLCRDGFLCLGSRENLKLAPFKGAFHCFSSKTKIYQKKLESPDI